MFKKIVPALFVIWSFFVGFKFFTRWAHWPKLLEHLRNFNLRAAMTMPGVKHAIIFMPSAIFLSLFLSYFSKRKFIKRILSPKLITGGFIFLLLIFLGLFRQYLFEILAITWINLIAYLIGDWFLKKFWPKNIEGLEKIILSYALGMGVLSYLSFFLGISGFYYRQAVYILFLSLTLIFWRRIKKLLFDSYRFFGKWVKNLPVSLIQISWFDYFLIIILTTFLFLIFIHALAPEIRSDALYYHLTIPKQYIFNQRIVSLPSLSWTSHGPLATEMLFGIAMLIGNLITAKLVIFSFGIGTIGVVLLLARFFKVQQLALLSVCVFVSSQLTSWLFTSAFIDMATTLFVSLGIYTFLSWIKEKSNFWLYLTAIFIGISLATKYLAGYFVLPILVVFLYLSFISKDRFEQKLKRIFIFGAISLAVFSPWLIKNYLFVKNPFFPFLNNFFNPNETELNSFLNHLINYVRGEQLGMGRNLKSYFALPWNITVNYSFFQGAIGPFFLACLPFLIFFYKKVNQEVKISIFFVLGSLAFWSIGTQTTRYLAPILPLASVLVALTIDNLIEISTGFKVVNLINKAMILISILFLFTLTLPFWPDIFAYRIYPAPLTLVFKDRKLEERYIAEEVPIYPIQKWVNQNLVGKENLKVLSIGDASFLYADFPLVYSTFYPGTFFHQIEDEEQLITALKKENYTHILINRNQRLRDERFSLTSSFVDKYLTLMQEMNAYYLFKINYQGNPKLREKIYFDFIDNLPSTGFKPPWPVCSVGGVGKRVILDTSTSTIKYKVEIKPKTYLRFSTGLCFDGFDVSDGAKGEIYLLMGKKREKIFEGDFLPDKTWHEEEIDLSQYAGKEMEIEFKSESIGTGAGDWVGWGEPLLIQKF